MGYIIDFGHDKEREYLKYILRLRAVNNQVVDLAGNTWTAQSNVSVTNNDFIYFNNGYLKYNTNGVIAEGEDFTFSIWMQMDNTPPSEKEYRLIGSKINPDTPRIEYGDFSFFSISNRSTATNPNHFHCCISAVSKNINWESNIPTHSGFPFNTNINHFSCTRKNNQVYVFFNGTLHISYEMDYKLFSRIGISTMIGSWNDNGYNNNSRPPINCKIKDFCIIKGTALWTSNFTPPSDYLPDKW